MTEAEQPGSSAGEVARLLGVPVTTVRTWHQRYGLGPTSHEPHRHRRYGAADLARLRVMLQLTGEGVPAAVAARAALAAEPMLVRAPLTEATQDRAAVADVVRHAMQLDEAAMVAAFAAEVDGHGVVYAWDHLIRPALATIGQRQARTQRLIDVEHVLSRAVQEVLWSVPRPADPDAPRILLACAPEEQHSLPVEALAAALAEHGRTCRVLGARVPGQALHDAVRRTGPLAVLVWSQLTTTGDPGTLTELLALRPRPAVIAAGGPGWPAELPAGVERPADLNGALDRLLRISV